MCMYVCDIRTWHMRYENQLDSTLDSTRHDTKHARPTKVCTIAIATCPLGNVGRGAPCRVRIYRSTPWHGVHTPESRT
jgi:hypothetical protein